MNQSRGRLIRSAGLMGLMVVSTTVGLLLGESTVRLLGPESDFKIVHVSNERSVFQRSANPVLGYELKADYRNDDADLNESYPTTNSAGQRDVERDLEKPLGSRRIILLGDSVVEGHGVREIDDTMSRQLERMLSDPPSEVLNFGVSGYCTSAEVELLQTKGLSYDPDLVILLFTENDFDNFNREAFELGSLRRRPAWVTQLFERSALFRLICVRTNLFRFGQEVDPLMWNDRAIGENNVVDGLRILRRLREDRGLETVIAIWPSFSPTSIDDRFFMPGVTDQLVIERLAELNGISASRLSEYFKRDWRSHPGSVSPRQHYTIGDGLHPSVEGHQVAARALKSILESHMGKARSERSAPDQDVIAVAGSLGVAAPDYSALELHRGSSHFRDDDLVQAELHFRRALELNPDYADAHYNLGLVMARRGADSDAATQFEQALSLDPFSVDARNELGVAYARLGRLGEAEDQFRTAIRLDSTNPAAHANLGLTRQQQGSLEDAIEHYQRAVELDPEQVNARMNLGSAMAARGRLREALHQYREVLRLKPDHALAKSYVERIRADMGRPGQIP